MNTPLISIITITYNAEAALPATLASVGSQTFQDFEHLVIDGASKDGTVAIASRVPYAQMRIVTEPDQGLYDAMNKGLRLARGKYVVFLNAGDSFHTSGTLARYAAGIEKSDGEADIIYGDTDIVDAGRNFIGKRHLSAPARLSFESFAQGMLVCHQAFMVRKELAPEYDLRYRFSADYDWTVRCLKATQPEKCVNLEEVTIDYLHDGLTDRNKLKSLRERYRIMSEHYGAGSTLVRHMGFLARAIARKVRKGRRSGN